MAVVNMRDSRESASSPTFLAPRYTLASKCYFQTKQKTNLTFISFVSPPEWTWMSFPRRYLIAIMAFFGFFNIYSLRVNLSIAIVAMTENRTTIHANGTIGYVRLYIRPAHSFQFKHSPFFFTGPRLSMEF